jgi:hypothetical protein
LRRNGDLSGEAAECERLSAFAATRRWRLRAVFYDSALEDDPAQRKFFWAMREGVAMGEVPRLLIGSQSALSVDPVWYARAVAGLLADGCEVIVVSLMHDDLRARSRPTRVRSRPECQSRAP